MEPKTVRRLRWIGRGSLLLYCLSLLLPSFDFWGEWIVGWRTALVAAWGTIGFWGDGWDGAGALAACIFGTLANACFLLGYILFAVRSTFRVTHPSYRFVARVAALGLIASIAWLVPLVIEEWPKVLPPVHVGYGLWVLSMLVLTFAARRLDRQNDGPTGFPVVLVARAAGAGEPGVR